MKDFIIENARPEDAAAILEYLKIVGGETDNLNMGAEGIPIAVEVEEAFLRSMLDSSDDVMYAAKADGEIIGIANVSRLKRRMSHRASIGISVQQCAWHCGVGTALMEALLAFARKNGIEQLELEVRSDNDRAIRLYERFGFTKIGMIPAFLKVNGEDFASDYMVLPLKNNA